ncbi:MAG: ethanolamine utilization protein EutJ [Verrucomicrobia bacterium]|nr:MAG: ethanolamine utilization protein EutJ [Verrucomicrobiota bacterium]
MYLPFLSKAFRFLSLSFATALFALFVQSCQKKAGPESIRIGVFQSISGSEASYGHDAMIGLRMAEEEINSHGGVLGKPIELVVRDNQSKAGETSSIVRELISREHVVALIGEVASGRTLEAAPIAQRAGVPLIANSASNDKITQAGDFVFRVSYRDSQQGEVLARYIRSLGKSRAALLIDISKDHSTTVRKSFKKRFEELGGTIVAEQSYSGGDKDFLAQLTAIRNSGADCLVVPGYYTDAASILKQEQSLGMNLDTFGDDSWDSSDLVRVAGDAAEGAVFTDAFSAEDPDPVVQAFVEKYKKKYGTNPVSFTANAYDAVMLLVDAIKRAGNTNPKAIRDALAATRGLPGVSGNITFDQNRDPSKSMVLLKVRDGKFRFVRREIP